MKVALCIPTRKEPFPQTVAAIDAALPLLREAGHTVGAITQIGSAYISWAQGQMIAKALIWGADAAVIIEDDMSFAPDALLKLIETPGDVVAGNYRYKDDTGEFMGFPLCKGDDGGPLKGPTLAPGELLQMWVRSDGCIVGKSVPCGFIKITAACVARFREAYPELICDDTGLGLPFTDLFNHGAHKGVWFGQDFAFSRRWRDCGETVWIQPDLDISHWLRKDDGTYVEFRGNYKERLIKHHGAQLHNVRYGRAPAAISQEAA